VLAVPHFTYDLLIHKTNAIGNQCAEARLEMSNIFEPRSVDKSSQWRWFKDGVELSARTPVTNTFAAIFFMIPYFVIGKDTEGFIRLTRDAYSFLSVPIMIVFFVLSAEAANTGVRLKINTIKTIPYRARYFIAAYFGLWLALATILGCIYLIQVMTNSAGSGVPIPARVTVDSFYFDPGIALIGSLSGFLLIGAIMWFLPCLYAIDDIDLATGVDLGLRALDKNGFMFTYPLVLMLLTWVISSVSGILAIPIVAIIGSIIYVAYLDVFRGEGIWARRMSPVFDQNMHTELT
jgi:hypothetical protein